MAKLNLSQAAKLTGKNRTTIWRHINSGKLSSERDRDGLPFVDTSELIRVYGEIKLSATPKNKKMEHEATPSYSDLVKSIEDLINEQRSMKKQIDMLSNRLEDKNKKPIQMHKPSPEEDPEWPKEVNSYADITLRNDIRKKY